MSYFKYSQKINKWLKQYGYKVCKQCDQLLLLKSFVLSTDNKYSWYSAECNSCRNIRNKAIRNKNPERYREYDRNYYKDNKDKIINIQRKSKIKRKDKILEYDRKWQKENKEKCIEYQKKYREANLDIVRLRSKKQAKYYREVLDNSYLKAAIKRKCKLNNNEDIPKEMIIAEKLNIYLKRVQTNTLSGKEILKGENHA